MIWFIALKTKCPPRVFSSYSERTKAKIMAEATTLYIKSIIEHRDMVVKLRKFFERFFKDIDEAAKRLPVFLQVWIVGVKTVDGWCNYM